MVPLIRPHLVVSIFVLLLAVCPVNAELLPEEDAFLPLIADLREAFFSIRRERYKGNGKGFDAGSVSFGDYLPIVNFFERSASRWQFGIDGSLHATFNLDKSSYDLFNTDYLFGLNLQYTDGRSPDDGSLSVRSRLYHFSSHLGDEFILENPGFDRTNSSFEDLEVVAAYSIQEYRAYLGGGTIFRSNSIDDLDPLHVRWGAEYRSNYCPASAYWLAGADFELEERTGWHIGQSYSAGHALRGAGSRELRLMLSYFNGNSPQGQFYKDRLEYFGLGVYFLL